MALPAKTGGVVQNVQAIPARSGKLRGEPSPVVHDSHQPCQPKKARNTPGKKVKRKARSDTSPGSSTSGPATVQQKFRQTPREDQIASINGGAASSGAPAAPKGGARRARKGGSAPKRMDVAPQEFPTNTPSSAQQEPPEWLGRKLSDDLIEHLEDPPAVTPNPLAPKPQTAGSDNRGQGQRQISGKRPSRNPRRTAAAATPAAASPRPISRQR